MGTNDHPLLDSLDKMISDLGVSGMAIALIREGKVRTIKLLFLEKFEAQVVGRHLRKLGWQEITLRENGGGAGNWQMTADWIPNDNMEKA